MPLPQTRREVSCLVRGVKTAIFHMNTTTWVPTASIVPFLPFKTIFSRAECFRVLKCIILVSLWDSYLGYLVVIS